MGKESPEAREARFRTWWAGLSVDQRRQEAKAGHVRLRFHAPVEEKVKTPNQRKAERRRARGKR